MSENNSSLFYDGWTGQLREHYNEMSEEELNDTYEYKMLKKIQNAENDIEALIHLKWYAATNNDD